MQLLALHEGAIVSYSIVGEVHAADSARVAAETLLAEHLRPRSSPSE